MSKSGQIIQILADFLRKILKIGIIEFIIS